MSYRIVQAIYSDGSRSRRWCNDAHGKTGASNSRRTLLRGAGVGAGVAWLEPCCPRAASAGRRHSAPGVLRLLPDGLPQRMWTTSGTGSDFTLPSIATALTPYKSKLSMITVGNHARSVGNWRRRHPRPCHRHVFDLRNPAKPGSRSHFGRPVIARLVGKRQLRALDQNLGVPASACPASMKTATAKSTSTTLVRGPARKRSKDRQPATLFKRLITCSSLQGMPA